MDGGVYLINNSLIDIVASENRTWLERFRILNGHLPHFLIHIIPSVYFAFGAILNTTLFVYVVRSGRWRSSTFTVIGSLSIADSMVCLGGLLWASLIYPVIKYRGFAWVCQLSILVGFSGLGVGGYTLIFFACLRFYQLKYPLAARARVTCSCVLKWLAVIWVVQGNYCGVLFAILYRPKEVLINGVEELICEQIGNRHAVNIGFLIINTIIPSISIAGLHSAKYFALKKSQKEMDVLDVQQKRRNTDARAVSIVILMYIICWFPVNTYSVVMGRKYTEFKMFQDNLYLILLSVLASNSTFNPIIYCIAAKTIRDDFIRFICGKRKTERS